jgi:RNA polymerase sigma-70 factor (ECF subfamily)
MRPDEPDDSELMRRVQRGDPDAFEQLVNRHRQSILNFAARILGDVTEAEDVAQAAFVQVHKAAARYRTTAKFTTWLLTITRNLCLNELRRRNRHPADALDDTGPDDDHAPRQFEQTHDTSAPDALLHAEFLEKLEAALAALPENQRTALLLHQRDALSYEEIGRVLGCSLPATKSLIFRARETLKARLKPFLRSGAWPVGS